MLKDASTENEFSFNLFVLTTVYAIYFASLIFRESGLQDIFASG